jgi:hypothetical protein
MKVKHRYKIGDIVWVVEPGHTYNQYTDKFTEMGFTPVSTDRGSFAKYTRAEIWGVSMHQDRDTPLYAIRDFSGDESLVGEKAITPVTTANKELRSVPDVNVVFDKLRPEKGAIQWHPDTMMITLKNFTWASGGVRERMLSANMATVQLVRFYNPDTNNYADYAQTGWNDTYSHYTDPVYNTHLRLDVHKQ